MTRIYIEEIFMYSWDQFNNMIYNNYLQNIKKMVRNILHVNLISSLKVLQKELATY